MVAPDMAKRRTPDRLLTLEEAAAYLQVGSTTVRRLILQDDLPAIKIGSQWRFHPKLLNNWRKTRKRKAVADGF